MAQTSAIVVIPGSFAPAHLYSTFVDKLQASGYPNVVTESLPSVGKREGKPAATMARRNNGRRRPSYLCDGERAD
jgi:hypothetical protein